MILDSFYLYRCTKMDPATTSPSQMHTTAPDERTGEKCMSRHQTRWRKMAIEILSQTSRNCCYGRILRTSCPPGRSLTPRPSPLPLLFSPRHIPHRIRGVLSLLRPCLIPFLKITHSHSSVNHNETRASAWRPGHMCQQLRARRLKGTDQYTGPNNTNLRGERDHGKTAWIDDIFQRQGVQRLFADNTTKTPTNIGANTFQSLPIYPHASAVDHARLSLLAFSVTILQNAAFFFLAVMVRRTDSFLPFQAQPVS
ncbi:hypothetical protein CLAIMM_02073, partial [Cladophialophora immunda]